VVDISDRMQCPIDYVAASSIVALGSLIGARCSIHPKRQDGNWFIVPNLWGAIIGKPSTLKSPALADVLRPIRRLEMDSRDEHSKAMQEHKMKAHMAKAQEEKIMRDLADIAQGKYKGTKSAEELQAECNAIEFPKEPQWKRYHTNDATVEKLSELLSANPQGMLVFRDELIGLLKSWEKEGHAGDRAFFLEAWNGFGSHITDRIGRGTIYTENVCLSLLGSTQPSRLAQYLRQGLRDIGNDGLIQRFQLMVMPDDVKEWQLVDRTGNMFAKERADLIFATLSVMDYVQHGARTSDDKKPPYFRFDDAAQELFYEWLIRLETVKLRGNEEGLLLEHLTKYRKLMPALALIFHLVSVADGTASGAVSAEATRLAIAWCDYLETHARRIYHMATDITQQAAKALSRRSSGDRPGLGLVRDDDLFELARRRRAISGRVPGEGRSDFGVGYGNSGGDGVAVNAGIAKGAAFGRGEAQFVGGVEAGDFGLGRRRRGGRRHQRRAAAVGVDQQPGIGFGHAGRHAERRIDCCQHRLADNVTSDIVAQFLVGQAVFAQHPAIGRFVELAAKLKGRDPGDDGADSAVRSDDTMARAKFGHRRLADQLAGDDPDRALLGHLGLAERRVLGAGVAGGAVEGLQQVSLADRLAADGGDGALRDLAGAKGIADAGDGKGDEDQPEQDKDRPACRPAADEGDHGGCKALRKISAPNVGR